MLRHDGFGVSREWRRVGPLCLTGFVTLAAACSGTSGNAAAPPPSVPSTPLPRGSLAALSLDVSALGPSGFVSEEAFLDQLSSASLVCLGEEHDNLIHHALQRRVVAGLIERAAAQQRPFALGLEMFQLPTQPGLDAYAAGTADETQLLEQSDYERRWGFDFEYYRDPLELTKSHQGKLLALNAPREWTKAVVKYGRAGLTKVNASLSPNDLFATDQEHQNFFAAAMGAFHPAHRNPGAHGLPQRPDWADDPYYLAQLVWDETMAQTAAAWLGGGPTGLVVVLAGAGHCHRSAIPRRFERRTERSRAVGVQLRTRRGLTDPSIPAASAFEWVLIAEDR